MKRVVNFSLCLLLLVAMLVNLAGCNRANPTATPAATLSVSTATPVTASATPVAPTATQGPTLTPTSSPTPLPPQPPRLLGRAPERGEELATEGAIVLRFDQPMDAASVENALSIAPNVKGTLLWDDPSTARFQPDAAFARDTLYRVSLDSTAQSAEKLALAAPVEFSVHSVGYLEVTSVSPAPESTDVPADSVIRVIFNRPVVPLVNVGAQQDLASPVTFTPDIAGVGQWTNTSIYTFQPSAALAAGTQYTASVAAGLQDTTGGVLAEDYSWSFTTQLPDVISVSPWDGMQYVSPKTTIEVAFNQPMQPTQTQSRFSLTPKGGRSAVKGSFNWRDASTLVFTPSQPLDMGGAYEIRLAAGSPAASGQASVSKDYMRTFTVAGLPEVVTFTPKDGETNIDPNRGIAITFSSPISPTTLLEGLMITPETTLYDWWQEDNTAVNLNTVLQPSTKYTVHLTNKLQGLYGGALTNPQSYEFTTAPLDPAVWLDVPDTYGSYSAYGTPTVSVRFRNMSEVNLAVYRITSEDFVDLNREGNWNGLEKYQPRNGSLVRAWTQRVSAPLNETGAFSTTVTTDGSALAAGLYYMRVQGSEGAWVGRHVMVVTDMNLTLKTTMDEALTWVTDLQTGQPVQGVAVQVYGGAGQLVGEAVTDRDGVALTRFEEQDPWVPLIVVAKRGESYGVALRTWSNGLNPWDFGLDGSPYRQAFKSHLYTERLIYRPGQTVYFKGILRADDDGAYTRPPAGDTVSLTVMDSQGRQFWQKELPLTAMGTFYDAIDLDENAALGYYQLQANYNDYYFSASFQVAEYRKPEFQVSVTLDRNDYIQGDTIQAKADASYYFGGPVGNAVVRWRVLTSPYYFDRWQGEGYYSFTDYDEYDWNPDTAGGTLVTEGEGETDAEGAFEFLVPADIAERVQSQVYTIEASVQDVNNQEVSARASAVVHKGEFYIGLSPLAYVGTAGEEQAVRVITVDTQGITTSQQSLLVVISQHEWLSVREKADDGYYYWTTQVRDTPVATQTVTTDANGVALVRFTPEKGGTYKVSASGLDSRENKVRSATYLWVSGTAFVSWRQENNDRIALIADKEAYKPGEMAKVLIPSPYQGETVALVTIERGKIIEHQVRTLRSNSEQLNIPILPGYAPNVYISVVIVKGIDESNPMASFKLGYAMLSVSTEQQELSVSITPDKAVTDGGLAQYRPRDTVVYDVQTLDYRGQGVAAEVSLQLVDLAVEALTGADTANIVDSFYRQRALAVTTASTLAVSVDRHNLERANEGKGGGGGGDQGLTVRQNLPDTAYWAPAVQTDSTGHATVEVTLPDNLTTWRMTAQAVTPGTKVGAGRVDVVSTLDVMVRPVAPRFMVIGDKPILGAVVHNNTSQALTLKVSLQAEGVSVQQAEQTLDVPAHSRQTLEWPATVDAAEQAVLLYSVTGGGYSDAIQLTLPVYHVSTPETVGTAGVVTDHTIELIRVPQDADTSAGQLSVQLEPSLAAGMREGLRYLETYPYGCIEQTVSRFLPNVVTYRALGELGIDNKELAARLPQQVAIGLQRLYTLQQLDGGWGWWGGDASSPSITAYVVLGLHEARQAGFLVDPNVLDRGVGFLRDWLDAEEQDNRQALDTRATVLYSLAEAGQGDLGRTVALFEKRGNLSLFAQGYLAMALQLLAPDEPSRLTTLASELDSAAIVSATGAHWEEAQRASWAMNTDTRSTAIVLRALVRIQPENGLLPNVVRWLMTARQTGRWETTQENVWSILALTDYMVSTGELLADYNYEVWLNGVSEASASVNTDNLDEPTRLEVPVADLQLERDNALIIERSVAAGQTGKGMLYYSAFLNYYLPADKIAALNRGIIVDRQYVLVDDGDHPVTAAKVNDVIEVRLTLIAPNDLNFLVLEDPLPAGCEAIDTSLQTTSSDVSGPGIESTGDGSDAWRYRGWWTWATHSELRDEKVALFADYLPRGTYEYVYQVRCTTPGQFQVMPAVAYEMYAADVFGRSAGGQFSISQ